MERAQKKVILNDLTKKMVLLAGPRQAGKTTLAKEIGRSFRTTTYLNYDHTEDRRIIHNEGWPLNTELLILDEIDKMPLWKGYLKGVYDTKPDSMSLLVTGSARLETFTQVGDSLAGRYFHHHLLPLSPAELALTGNDCDLDHLLERGGFPEPFLAETPVEAQRWRRQYIETLLREDVLEFETIQNVRESRFIFELLRERVGSPVSYSSLARDVAIAPNTVKRYIAILEALYIVFRLTPYSRNIARSLLKEPKIYFFDTGLVKGDQGIRFENLVATCLLKNTLALTGQQGVETSLHYLRTKEKKEVDFALVRDHQMEKIIEVKNKQRSLAPALWSFYKKYQFPAIQIVKELRLSHRDKGIDIVPGKEFLLSLSL